MAVTLNWISRACHGPENTAWFAGGCGEYVLPRIIPLRVSLRARQPAVLPSALGRAFFRALDQALRDAACSDPTGRDCAGCLSSYGCIYQRLRGGPIGRGLPAPFALAPEGGPVALDDDRLKIKAGQALSFGLTVVGRATDELHLLVIALLKMAEHGLSIAGREYENAGLAPPSSPAWELVSVVVADPSAQLVYDGATDEFMEPSASVFVADALELDRVTIEFVTPLRLRRGGVAQSRFLPTDFFGALARRVGRLCRFHEDCAVPPNAREVLRLAQQVKFAEVLLRLEVGASNGRGGGRGLLGVCGRVSMEGAALARLWPLLRYGEMVQVGSLAAVGFGRYRILERRGFSAF